MKVPIWCLWRHLLRASPNFLLYPLKPLFNVVILLLGIFFCWITIMIGLNMTLSTNLRWTEHNIFLWCSTFTLIYLCVIIMLVLLLESTNISSIWWSGWLGKVLHLLVDNQRIVFMVISIRTCYTVSLIICGKLLALPISVFVFVAYLCGWDATLSKSVACRRNLTLFVAVRYVFLARLQIIYQWARACSCCLWTLHKIPRYCCLLKPAILCLSILWTQ